MSLRSKNFLYYRLARGGDYEYFQESDSWYQTNPDYKWNETTENMPASGYYGTTSGICTISFTLRNFIGRISVQATLANVPTEDDWFDIKFCSNDQYYLEFGNQQIYDIYNSNHSTLQLGTTGAFAESVSGNFTFMRVVISRDYLSLNPTEYQMNNVGKLEEILINY